MESNILVFIHQIMESFTPRKMGAGQFYRALVDIRFSPAEGIELINFK